MAMPRPGPSGTRTMPPACSIGAGEHRLAEGMLGAVELEQRLTRGVARRIVRQHGEQLQRGGEADAGAPHVRHAAHAEGRGHVGDLLALRQAAGGADVGLRRCRRRGAAKTSRKFQRVNQVSPPATGIGWPRRTST